MFVLNLIYSFIMNDSIVMRLLAVILVVFSVCLAGNPSRVTLAASFSKDVDAYGSKLSSAYDKSADVETDTDIDTDAEVVLVTRQFDVTFNVADEPSAADLDKIEDKIEAELTQDLIDLEGGEIPSTVRVVCRVDDVKTYRITAEIFVEDAPDDDIDALVTYVDTEAELEDLLVNGTTTAPTYDSFVPTSISSVTATNAQPITSSPSPSPSVYPSSSPSSSPTDDDDDGLSDGAVVGIVLGVGVGGIGLLSTVCYLIYGKDKSKDGYVESGMADATL